MTRVMLMMFAGSLGAWAAPTILLAQEDEEAIEEEAGPEDRRVHEERFIAKRSGGEEPLLDEEEREGLKYMRENAPELHKRMARARGPMRAQLRHRFRELGHLRRDPEVRKRMLETMKAQIQVQELAEEYRRTEDKKDREALKKKLEQALSEAFDTQLKNHELRIKKMQDEIGKMQEKISKKRSMKEKLVKKRLERLTGEDEEEEW